MRLHRVLYQRARSLFRGAQVEAELQRELAYHLEQLTQENVGRGMQLHAARLEARRALGGLASIEEQCRDHRHIGWIFDIGKDITYARRALQKSPGFSALAALTLAFGVGASIAVYALAEALLLRSLPYPSPERLTVITSIHVQHGESGVGQENFRDWQVSNTVFERMAFTEFSQLTLTGLGEPERVTGGAVSEGFLELFAVPPQLGRWFSADEQQPGKDRVIMLSHDFWLRRMGARPDAVGSTVYLNDLPYRITGVMPKRFRLNEGHVTEYWTPISYRASGRQQHQYAAYGRLKPGVTVKAAQAQMTAIARRLEAAFPDNAGWGVRVAGLRSALLEESGPALLIFMAAALIVLLVACGNVASLMLARGIGRSKEVAVRMALGAGRGRVLRLFLIESLLVASLGAAAGVALAYWLIQLTIAASPPWFQLGELISISPTLVVFCIVLTMVTGMLTGLWPAIRGSRTNLQYDLKESGSSLVAGRRQTRSLNTLVVMEIALAVVLLTFAGLLAKSFAGLLRVNLGYRADRLLTFRMALPASRYPNQEARLQFWNRLLPQLAVIPGVISSAAADSIPLGGTYAGTPVEVAGETGNRKWADVMTRAASITPEYFRTMGITVRAGRPFDASDTASKEPALIVNEAFVRKFLPDRDALGARVRLGKGDWQRVIGIIGDAHYQGPARPVEPEAYTSFTRDAYLQFVVLRTAVPEDSVLSTVRKVIHGVDSGLPITQVRTMRQSLDMATALPRTMMALHVAFAAVTLGMAILGLGGVMAYTVSRRRREIGLRIALGARPGEILRDIFRDSARLIAAGCLIGTAGALAGARLLESLLFGVRPHDAAVMTSAPALLAVVALLACILPARRAASIDPMSALRQE